jgi:Zn finger protein HypA/HybF involved in hydrogenase expression
VVAELKLDALETAGQVTLTVVITHYRKMKWRVMLAIHLIKLADFVSPVKIEIIERIGEPCLYNCPYCGWEFASHFIPGKNHTTANCPHCNRQSFVIIEGDGAHTVRDPQPCDYGCEFIEPYGFVPEAECPIHD